jgi:pyruvate,water dikinase
VGAVGADVTGGPGVVALSSVAAGDVGLVGGKNASLGELLTHLVARGIDVPGGFAVTTAGYWELVDANDLRPVVAAEIARFQDDPSTLAEVGATLRARFADATVPGGLDAAIRAAYRALADEAGIDALAVAVRSSATAEDQPDASFAGQHDTFLDVVGDDEVVDAVRRCMASLFTDRAIVYREENGIDHLRVALSVGVQRMVRSDVGGAGTMFTIDPDSGFPDLVVIDAVWGLGEGVVQGAVDPDRYRVFTPLLDRPDVRPIVSVAVGAKAAKVVWGDDGEVLTAPTSSDERATRVLGDDETLRLARWAATIADHYGRPMDIEWAKDGLTDDLFVVQARPETVHTRLAAARLVHHRVRGHGPRLVTGLAVGESAATGPVHLVTDAAGLEHFPEGGVLVAEITDPDWVPAMRRAAAIVTDRGGRTSHAAIVSREFGVPAVVGAGSATSELSEGRMVTVSCAEGDVGYVYDGAATIEREEVSLTELPATRTRVMLNLANPAAALRWWRLPASGIGLARMEFIVNEHIGIHPMALAHPERVDDDTREEIRRLTTGYDDPADFFVDRLASGVATLAASVYPHPTILRLSDFKTNEYASLVGGAGFEPDEENPMLGWRGASRYYHEGYRDGFALECRGVRKVREELGFTNVVVMVPFCRTPAEADRVLEVMADEGLERGRHGLEVYVMAEIPSNVILTERFADRFDGFSIGSNDLTQLTLGIDRDSEILAGLGDASDEAVTTLIRDLIARAHAHDGGRKVGFCGQAPSNDPAYARFLVDAGIDSVSVTPDSFVAVTQQIAAAES